MSNLEHLRHANVITPRMELSADEMELIESYSREELEALVAFSGRLRTHQPPARRQRPTA